MNTPHYLHPNDAIIDRDTDPDRAFVDLLDEEGTRLYPFPRDWTDEQIMHALSFANIAYLKGMKHGQEAKAREIRKALDIKEPS